MKLTDFLAKLKKPRKGLNKPLMLAVAKRMRNLRHEEHYQQSTWGRQTMCGTAGCLAFHTVVAAGLSPAAALKLVSAESIAEVSRQSLGLSSRQADRLFDVAAWEWPEAYAKRFEEARRGWSEERPSRVAADMLEAIAKGKVKL